MELSQYYALFSFFFTSFCCFIDYKLYKFVLFLTIIKYDVRAICIKGKREQM
jgi:hypothetical protein